MIKLYISMHWFQIFVPFGAVGKHKLLRNSSGNNLDMLTRSAIGTNVIVNEVKISKGALSMCDFNSADSCKTFIEDLCRNK